jgi:prepilin-type N-terminal cleavage/methylation domain-containing protein
VAKHRVQHRAVGFTLLEMMVTTAVMSIFAVASGAFIGWQMKRYMTTTSSTKLDDRARGLKNALRDEGHQAGFAFSLDANSYGFRPTGDCLPPSAGESDHATDTACSGQDEGTLSDRLRFVYGLTEWPWIKSGSSPSNGPCVGGTQTAPNDGVNSAIMISPNDLWPPGSSPTTEYLCYIIGGDCVAGSTAPAATIEACASYTYPIETNTRGCAFVVPIYWQFRNGSGSGCTNGWKPGYRLARFQASDYRMTQNTTDPYYSLLRRDYISQGVVMAQNISHFQITYGLDLSDEMDGKLDPCPQCTDDPYAGILGQKLSWCRDLDNGCNMTLVSGAPLTPTTKYNRIVAIHVAFKLFDTDPTKMVDYAATINLKSRLTP